ncbi:O-Antigen ligase [Polystyrenella longa]|uniref:O-Antigen ligase n=1 Tax=Polystyrenella longa TaxID=2528007 RepID=A0A518CR51_9PLAN|nr:O-antigen ligase family protein [Polystyrenella longa]QDU81712.1 O-Antigen ligase [Polystyrenella longa]
MNGVVRAIVIVASIIIVGAILVFPWFNGGADTRPQVYFLQATIAAVTVALLCSLISSNYRPNIPTAALVLLMALGLAGLQLVPMDNSLWNAIGNNTPELRHEMTSARGLLLAGEQAESSPLSLYPSGTQQDIAMLLVGIIFFMLGAQFLSRFVPFRLFMILLASNGALLACLGFLQQITWNGKLYWSLPIPQGGTPFAAFIYHNQAASIFAFSLAASIGYLIDIHRRNRGIRHYDRTQGTEWDPRSGSRTLDSLQYYIADLNGERLFAISVLLLNMAGLLFSLSRGGLLCFLIAGIIVWTYASFKQGRSTWVNVFLVGGVLVGLLTWVSVTDVVSDRLQTLLKTETFEQESRLPHWQDTLGAVQDYGTYGTGLGTYRYIYHRYQNHINEGWFLHAHNQYLEALVDAGIPGLALMLIMILLVLYSCWKLFNSDYFYTYVVAIVGGLALFFQIFHAAVDYCLYLPATMVIFASLTGALVGRSVRALDGTRNILVALPYTSWAWPVVLAGLLGGSLWSYSRIESLLEMETVIKSYPSETELSKIQPRKIRGIISQLEDVLVKRPGDAQGHEALAEYYVSLYRLEARTALAKELKVNLDDRNLWEWTSPVILSNVAKQAYVAKKEDKLKDIREQETVVEYLNPSIDHLKESLRSCPLLSNVHYRIDLLGFLDQNWTFQEEHLTRAELLGSWNADLMYLAGQVRFARGDKTRAVKDWNQSLRIDDRHMEEIVRIASTWMTPEELLNELIPNNPEAMMLIAERMYSSPSSKETQEIVFERLTNLLEEQTWPSGTPEYFNARIAVMRGQSNEALELFTHALFLNPNDLEWQFQYALVLRGAGKLQEAERILSYCVRKAPGRIKFSNLLNLVREQQKQQDAMKSKNPSRS